MKKNILLIAAALFLFLGNQSVTAQAKMKKDVQTIGVKKTEEVSAKKKVTSLIRPLALNKKQQEQVYNLFAKTEEKMSRSGASSDAQKQEVMQAKMNKYVMDKMKEILTEEQFKKYLDLAKDL